MNGSPGDNLQWLVQALRPIPNRCDDASIASLRRSWPTCWASRCPGYLLPRGLIVGARMIADALAGCSWHREWDVVEPMWTRLR
ncbi:hypothetical protein [Saccharopolyspora pogona]|uniref:hypothetical protein n=1 Tax=Saccharopolyspora pogona TaxID=333966 RepID=UPI00168892AB|nr:hypothetical protein [Saccharopolyspora pogona]